MKKLLMILSGGMDSTTCLFMAKQQHDEIHAITFDYGQTHELELVAANRVALLAKVDTHEVISIPNILRSTSPLTSKNDLKEYKDYHSMVDEVGFRVEETFVPMRNFLFLIIAANRAIEKGCDTIGLGICEADTANYPDCTNDFLLMASKAINESIGSTITLIKPEGLINVIVEGITLWAPLIFRTKKDTIQLAYDTPGCWEALRYTHTSYANEFPPLSKNHANLLRAKAFEDANLPDPLILRAHEAGLMNLPETSNYEIVRNGCNARGEHNEDNS